MWQDIEAGSEDSYGRLARLRFVSEGLCEDCCEVLDVGCGTGTQLTLPLALRFPSVRFLGIDADFGSIEDAKAHNLPANLSYRLAGGVPEDSAYDIVIASEVLEHVEDPHAFLLWLRGRLRPGGKLLLTIPNGYGPAELSNMLEAILTISKIWPAVRWLKRGLLGGGNASSGADTLATSPHVNFFSLRSLQQLFGEAGLSIARFAPRTLLCGFIFDQLVSVLKIQDWNASVVSRMPPWLASDWMFELIPVSPPGPTLWTPSFISNCRRRLNRRRWLPQ